jgi:hypothetical protein
MCWQPVAKHMQTVIIVLLLLRLTYVLGVVTRPRQGRHPGQRQRLSVSVSPQCLLSHHHNVRWIYTPPLVLLTR